MLNIDYVEGLDISTKATIGSIEGIDCTLSIANNSFPHLKLENMLFNKELFEYLKNPPDIISCKSQRNIFTLYDIKPSGSVFIPEFIVSGEVADTFSGVDISLIGLYTFFDGHSNLEVKKTRIFKEMSDYFVKKEFCIAGEIFHFSVEHIYSYSKKIDTTTLIEDAIVRVWKPTKTMNFDEIRSIVKKIRILFSLLLGFDLSIRKTWLVTNNGERGNPFYFYAPSKGLQPFENPHDCFIYPVQELTDDDWNKILTFAFDNEAVNSISDFWVRLVSMFSYKGFWEYDILGVVSLLDAYSKSYHKSYKEQKMATSQFRKLKDQMKKILCDYEESLPIDSNLHAIIENMSLQLSYIKNTNAQDFRIILKLLMGDISNNILNVIDFKDEDFQMIIKIRNSAAHGAPISEDIMANLQRAMIVKEKIKFLMLYLFFKSMGFSDVSFINICRHSFNRIKLGARLDSYTIKTAFGPAVVFDIDYKNFMKVKKLPPINLPVIYHVKSERYEFGNSTLSKVIESLHSKKIVENNEITDLIHSNYFPDEIYSAEHLTSVFICNNKEKLEFHGVFLIKMND